MGKVIMVGVVLGSVECRFYKLYTVNFWGLVRIGSPINLKLPDIGVKLTEACKRK
jgi:hypothetical protein